jgi:transposase
VIAQEFGVMYHPNHVRRLMQRLHWSYQRPIVRASERDDAVVSEWLERTWPAAKKEPNWRVG